MSRPDDDLDLYELLNRVDELIEEQEKPQAEDFEPEYDDDIDMDDTIVFLNAANGYGQDVRNAANGYGRGRPQEEPPVDNEYTDDPVGPAIHAYNADFRRQRGSDRRKPQQPSYDDDLPRQSPPPRRPPLDDPPAAPAKPAKTGKKKRGCLTKLFTFVLIFALVLAGLHLLLRPPVAESDMGIRKPGTAAILLCGSDLSGDRTDTMMLLYVDALKNEAGLLTLPRDTYTVTDYGASNKLNSAYGRNGGGEEGMQVLLDYVQDIIGYRPDGYMLVQLPMLKDLVDLMGGVEFDVPQDMTSEGYLEKSVTLQAGLQQLNGEQAMALLRFRYGYANQDLGRQDVQKQFLKACVGQWATPANVMKLPQAMELFETQGMSNLRKRNYIWLGFNILKCGFKNISTDTLPGYATYIGDQSFYVLNPEEVASLIQEKYNPYIREITADDLRIPVE